MDGRGPRTDDAEFLERLVTLSLLLQMVCNRFRDCFDKQRCDLDGGHRRREGERRWAELGLEEVKAGGSRFVLSLKDEVGAA